ncbi:S49 family peptidase [Paraburkholderia nodosa]|uniref:S49 family peptidase n=1 Tax=Paraburkholderia nodosa TaxID=392320 RepID=UPI0008416800|nr:S49 family peptidase [Paraburkholderia nodosa]
MEHSIVAIHPAALHSVDGVLSLAGGLAAPARAAGGNPQSGGRSVAVLSLCGVIAQRAPTALLGSPRYGLTDFQGAFRAALNDPAIGSILLDVDSPGGSIYGVGELASEIYGARGQKRIVAIANSMAASAAYWIASAAGEFYVTPGGEVGSIGVYVAHFDMSGAQKQVGIETTLISAGKHKVDGNPYQPLDAEARKFMQSRVDDYYRSFTGAVARHRSTTSARVRSQMGGGRLLGAGAAHAAGMVDGIASYRTVIGRLLAGR